MILGVTRIVCSFKLVTRFLMYIYIMLNSCFPLSPLHSWWNINKTFYCTGSHISNQTRLSYKFNFYATFSLSVCWLKLFSIIYLCMLAVKLAIRHSCHSIVAVWAHVWLSFFNLSSVLICLSGSSIVMMSIHKLLPQDTHWNQREMYAYTSGFFVARTTTTVR